MVDGATPEDVDRAMSGASVVATEDVEAGRELFSVLGFCRKFRQNNSGYVGGTQSSSVGEFVSGQLIERM